MGKYTVANEFKKKTGYKFFHNHHAYDLARSLFERGTLHINSLYEDVNFLIFKEVAKAKLNVITTHAYSASFVSRTGLSDLTYMKKIESIVKKAGGQTYFVHLAATNEALLKRVKGKSRSRFNKLRNPKILKETLSNPRKDWKTTAPVKNNLVIDNTNLSPQKVADMIIKHFKIMPQ
ncbi:MAG: hypothetical protein Q8O46_01030 [bacterium]|nr:hypothetical protein [bacterium]